MMKKLLILFYALFVFAGYFKGLTIFSKINSNIDVTILMYVITLILVFMKMLKNKFYVQIPFKLFMSLIILLCIMLASILYTPAWNYGIDKFLRFVFLTLFALLVPIIAFEGEYDFITFSFCIMILSIVLNIENFINTNSIRGFHYLQGSNYIALGRLNNINIITSGYLYKKVNRKYKLITSVSLIISIFGLFYTGARGPIVAIIVSYLIYYAFYYILKVYNTKVKLNVKNIVIYMILTLILLGGFYKFYPYFANTFNRLYVLISQPSGGRSTSIRIKYFYEALEMFLNNLFLGVGIGGFSYNINGTDVRDYPHNILLEIASETGIIGLLSLIYLLFVPFNYLIKYINKNEIDFKFGSALLLLFLSLLINSLISGDINDNRFLFTVLGILYNAIIDKNSGVDISYDSSKS